MKTVIFGGSGFLGSHVADALSEAGHKVIIFDVKPSAYLNKSQKMVVGDIMDEKLVQDTLNGCGVVYNFAGISDVDEARKKPIDAVKYNILGNAILLEASRREKVKRFVFASSLYVYSKAGSFYRTSKQSCELLIENYNEVYGLPYTILRYGSLYGPRADERNFLHRIIKQALTEQRIVRDGDGDEVREYIHVLDAARGSVEILSKEFENQHVIITGNQQMKVKEILSMIREMFDNKIKIEYRPIDVTYHYEVTPYTFSPKLARRIISKTYLDLGQGILKCIQSTYKELNHFSTCDGLVIKKNNRGKK